MEIKLTPIGIEELIKDIDDKHRNQIPYALAKALTKVVQELKENVIKDMRRVFDRPTPWTLGGVYYKSATKKNLESKVWFKDEAGNGTPTAKYLTPQVFGGGRNVKRFEAALRRAGVLPSNMYAIPGTDAELDAYGNMSRGQIVKILSYFSAFGEQGYSANITEKKLKRMAKGTKKQRGMEYFVSRGDDELNPGIYSRTFFVWGSAIKQIIAFISRPTYPKRLPFYKSSEKWIAARLPALFEEALSEAIRTAK